MQVTSEDAIAEASAALADVIAAMDTQDVGERIGRHAVAVVSELGDRDDKDLEEQTILAAASNVEAVLAGLVGGAPGALAEPPAQALSWVSTLVQRGISASTVPRGYSVGQAICDMALRDAIAQIDAPPEVKWELAGTASQHLFAYVEKVSGDLIEHYERERDRWVRGADSIRTELVLAMVEGHPFDPATTSATLRYELSRPHVAIVVWSDPHRAEPAPTATLKKEVAALARELGGTDLLVLPAGSSVVWGWTTGPNVTDSPPKSLRVSKSVLGSVGSIADGPEGFIRSHREAREARRMAGVLARKSGSVVRYRSVALSALLTRDANAAAQFVEGELGVLAGDSDANRRLRATLAVLFEEGMSWGRAAKRLGIHQNTVIYRAKRAEELLGRSLDERRLELEAALRLADARGRLDHSA